MFFFCVFSGLGELSAHGRSKCYIKKKIDMEEEEKEKKNFISR